MTIRINTWINQVLFPKNYWIRWGIGYVVACALGCIIARLLLPMVAAKNQALLAGVISGVTATLLYLSYVLRPKFLGLYPRAFREGLLLDALKGTVYAIKSIEKPIDEPNADTAKWISLQASADAGKAMEQLLALMNAIGSRDPESINKAMKDAEAFCIADLGI